MNDPIKDLEELGGATMPINPLPPSEVRRRGDRLRRRRQGVTAAGTALAVAVIAGGGFMLAGGSDRAAEPPPAVGTSETTSQQAVIPDGFPLADGLAGARTNHRAALADKLDFCGRRPLRGAQAADVRSAELSGGEAAFTRSLYLFDGEGRARALHEKIVQAARACADPDPRDGSVVTVWATNRGAWTGNTVVHEYADEPTTEPSTQVIHVVTKGSAVLVTSSFGAWQDDHVAGVESTRDEVSGVVEAMDEFGEVPEGLPVPFEITDGP